MTSPASLTGSQLRTYNTIFQHPVSHNLEWRHVRVLLETLGEITEEPDDYFRHAHNSKDFSRGQEKPDPNSFFGSVAKALQAPGRILVFGTGTGTSSEMEQFIAWAELHHPELAKRIIGCLVVDEHHLSLDQLLAKAREFYASAGMPLWAKS